MTQYLHPVSWTILVVATLGLTGCGGGDGHPRRVHAGGTVTYNDDPVADAQVVFRVAGGHAATAVTDEDGQFTLSTFGQQDGAIPGEHTATVIKMAKVAIDDSASDPSNSDTMEEAVAAAEQDTGAGDAPTGKSLIPDRYGNPETSGLKFTVSESARNDFDITLTD